MSGIEDDDGVVHMDGFWLNNNDFWKPEQLPTRKELLGNPAFAGFGKPPMEPHSEGWRRNNLYMYYVEDFVYNETCVVNRSIRSITLGKSLMTWKGPLLLLSHTSVWVDSFGHDIEVTEDVEIADVRWLADSLCMIGQDGSLHPGRRP